MLVKELRGTESTQDACAKMRVKHKLKHVFVFAHSGRLCSETSNRVSHHNCGLDIKGIDFYTLSWVPPPPPTLDCLFLPLLSVSCYHISLYFTPTPTPTLSSGPSVRISHSRPQRLQSECNIHENPTPLIFTLTHQRGPHSFSEYLHAPPAIGRCSRNTGIIMIMTTIIMLVRHPPSFHPSSMEAWIPTSEPSVGDLPLKQAALLLSAFFFFPMKFYLILTRLNYRSNLLWQSGEIRNKDGRLEKRSDAENRGQGFICPQII